MRHEHPERVLMLRVPSLETDAAVPADERPWLTVVRAVQQVVPGASPVSPGWCAMRARGPMRYYGGEAEAAKAVLDHLATHSDEAISARATAGVANGSFAARQAVLASDTDAHVHSPYTGVRIVREHHTVAFLAALPVSRLENEKLVEVLISLGIHILRGFAALPEPAVLQRFGREGELWHRRARGLSVLGTSEVTAAAPLVDFSRSIEFEPPVHGTDQLAFACASLADVFVHDLTSHGRVCTELHIEVHDDSGTTHPHLWAHPTNFTATDVVNRIRWQAGAVHTGRELALDREDVGVTKVQLSAHRTAAAAAHEPGLFSNAPDERVHHQLTRAQSLLGHQGIGTETLLGGRLSTDRQALLPWGVAQKAVLTKANRVRTGPWPGALPGAQPNTVFHDLPPVTLFSTTGDTPVIDADELLSAPPAKFGTHPAELHSVQAWSAPWPVRERWWQAGAKTLFRLQVVLESGDAWLLLFEAATGWHAEGRYN